MFAFCALKIGSTYAGAVHTAQRRMAVTTMTGPADCPAHGGETCGGEEPEEPLLLLQLGVSTVAGRGATEPEASATERRALGVVAARGTPPPASVANARRLALLFLVVDRLYNEAIWDRFFEGAPEGSFSVYVHRAAGPSLEQTLDQPPLPLAKWGALEVPKVPSAWCGLVGAMAASLLEALREPANVQFAFLSHDAVPLKRFAYVHWRLVGETRSTSKVCLASPAQSFPQGRRCAFRDNYHGMDPRVAKHHQWVVLARDHAVAVVERVRAAYEVWWRAHVRSSSGGCADEAVPLTALLMGTDPEREADAWEDLPKLGVESSCLTFMQWQDCLAGTRLDPHAELTKMRGLPQPLSEGEAKRYAELLRREEEEPRLCGRTLEGQVFHKPSSGVLHWPRTYCSIDGEYLRRLVGEGFMFARKFGEGALVFEGEASTVLEKFLSAEWSRVDESVATRRAWSRLDFLGQPAAETLLPWVGST